MYRTSTHVSNSAQGIVTISNRLGLHARPATALAELAGSFTAEIKLRRIDTDHQVDAKSIMQLLMLAATRGTELEVTADGNDASEALAAIADLVSSHFGEE
mgnify:CR=1 FL=1